MKYQWKDAAHISVSADLAGQMCEQLEKTVGLTAKTLLDANRNPGTPLHDAFEWNDGIAAEKFREEQAAHIIRCLCIHSEQSKEETVRAFFTVEKTVYESLSIIIGDEDKRSRLLAAAMREFEAYRRKYNSLKALLPLFNTFEEIKNKEI